MPHTVKFDHYEVLTREDGSLHELGRGAMGTTYKAFDTSLHCEVALKVINASYLDSEVARQRFVREARAAARLRHRNVATVFHLGEENGAWFYAMEFIDGETVEALIKRQGSLDPLLALRITAQVARALNAAYEEKLVHRDIKPSNLMIVREDDELVVKVIDFGLAKSSRREDGEDSATISMGGFVGTPHFASPEQLEERDIDVRSDIYSLGATLWYMLAGRAPFSGTMAQVMSQHLGAQPPFQQFASWPKPIVDLLTKMLEKDAAHRQQTPTELRHDIERCIEALSLPLPLSLPASPGKPVPVKPVEDEQDFPTVAAITPPPAAMFRVGNLVGGQYKILADLGEGSLGSHYLAESAGRQVRLITLPDQLSPSALGRLEAAVERVRGIRHENLLEIIGIETVGKTPLLILEWNRGFSLTELLRARRELPSPELLPILDQVATGVDFAIGKGMETLDATVQNVFFDLPESDAPVLQTPVSKWPGFAVKLLPVSIQRELSGNETWAGGMTLDAGLARGQAAPAAPSISIRLVTQLGALVYEMLGGTGSRMSNRYVPLARLSEAGNQVLKRCLDPAHTFSSATEFAHALRDAETSLFPSTPAPSISTAPSIPPVQPTPPPMPAADAVVPPPPVPAKADYSKPAGTKSSGKPGGPGIGIVLVCLVLVVGGVGAFFFLNRKPAQPVAVNQPPAQVESTPVPEVQSTPAPTPAEAQPSPVESAPPVAVAVATPESTPTPEPSPSATPTPAPNQREADLRDALAAAEQAENAGDLPKAMEGYMAIARDYPETDVGKVRLGIISEKIRANASKLSEADLKSMRQSLEWAAKLDIVSAMMLLGESLRKSEPDNAFAWFCAAADRGAPAAYTQVGLMYSNGAGSIPRDFSKAVWWFEQGAERKDVAAIFSLGECYLYGKGLPKDEKHAVDLLKEAVAAGEPRAMNLLGTCYHRGIGVPQNFKEAMGLFNSAQEKGFWDALGNLGVLYMNGEGVPADPHKAAALFQKGAKLDNAYCMFQYARCLEAGIGVEANKLAAEGWYRKSAEAGHPRAMEWCRANNVSFNPPK